MTMITAAMMTSTKTPPIVAFPSSAHRFRKRDQNCVRQLEGDASQRDHATERRDQRVDPENNDDEPVERAEKRAGDERRQECEGRANARIMHQKHSDGRGQKGDGSDGYVELASEHDKREAACDDHEGGHRVRHCEDIRYAREMLRDDGKEQEQRDHDQEEAVAREPMSDRPLAGDRGHATLLSVGPEAFVSETAASSASRSASGPNSPMTRPRWTIR